MAGNNNVDPVPALGSGDIFWRYLTDDERANELVRRERIKELNREFPIRPARS